MRGVEEPAEADPLVVQVKSAEFGDRRVDHRRRTAPAGIGTNPLRPRPAAQPRWFTPTDRTCRGGCLLRGSGDAGFRSLRDTESFLNFYNGGACSRGSTGTNYGISFAGNTLALIDSDAGGTGNFANEPTGDTAMFFLSGASTVLNVAAGFTESFSVFYSTRLNTGVVKLYDGVDGGGTLVGTIDLAALGTNCLGDPTGSFCNWQMASLSFAGTVRSVDFAGAVNFTAFDNVTFGRIGSNGGGGGGGGGVPGPGSLFLAAGAPLALSAVRRRRA